MSEPEPPILSWARQIRGHAAALLHFSTNEYDRERAHKLIALAAEMTAGGLDLPPAAVIATFERNLEVFTPLSTVDAALFDTAGGILLIRRSDNGLWAMPGGACEVEETAAAGALRELREETGVEAAAVALLGVWDSRLHGSRSALHHYSHVFLCRHVAGTPHPTAEATEVGYFAPTDLPPLSYGHRTRVPQVCALYQTWTTSGTITPYFEP